MSDLLQKIKDTEQAIEGFLATDNLSASEVILLALLHQKGDGQPSQLAADIGISRGRLSHILDNLLDLDLIHRKPHLTDGRSQIISLSAKGKLEAERANKKYSDMQIMVEPTMINLLYAGE